MNEQEARIEGLGPAERAIQSLTTHLDHLYHGRPGMVSPDTTSKVGVKWEPISWKLEGDKGKQEKVVYRLTKVARKSVKTKIGILRDDGKIVSGRKILGEYRKPGLFPEVVTWMYQQVAEVWKADNEFAAHWASWAFPRDHRDMKVILAAFMLCQNRFGEPVAGEPDLLDDDYRAVGEAMCLIRGKHDFNPKLLLRLGDVLAVPGVAQINRDLGFGHSARKPFYGRYLKLVTKWLRYREENIKLLNGLVRAGFRTSVIRLAQRVGYKPTSPQFFEILRWKQEQAKDGRRTIAIGAKVKKADTWEGLSERQICNRIAKDKPNWKLIVGKLPPPLPKDTDKPYPKGYLGGLTRAIVAAAVLNGCMSNADLIILTPTLEDMELLKLPDIQAKHDKALAAADNQRATNIARRVRKTETVEKLQGAADTATKKAMEEVTRGLRVYVIVDKSGSMQGAIQAAKGYLKKFLGGFPLDRLHVSVFNTIGMEITIKAASAGAVEQAFRGHQAAGGTCHATGVDVLLKSHKPGPEEDALFLFVGDEGEYPSDRVINVCDRHGVRPVAIGLLKVKGMMGHNGTYVQDTATRMGIPCFQIEEALFNTDDPYAVTRTLRNLISTTPVGTTKQDAPVKHRKSLLQEILETSLLQKPFWA